MDITIYHNPHCSNSRGALALIRAAGHEPTVIEYLNSPLERTALAAMIAQAGITVRDAMRTKEPVYADLGLDDPALDDGALLDAILAHPVLLNRPFVVTPLGARLCRPPDLVFHLLG